MYVCMYVCKDRFSTSFTALALLISFLTAQQVASKTIVPSVTASKVTITAPEQLRPYTSPLAQGFLDRLTFAPPQYSGNGTGTSFIPFSISGRTVPNDKCYAIALQPDGCIVMAGRTQNSSGNYYFAVARYLPSGELDPTFGQVGTPQAGTAYVPFSIAGGGTSDIANSITVQSDGKIILGGSTNTAGGIMYFALAQFTTAGTLDTTFGQTGTPQAGTNYVPFAIGGGGTADAATSITVQSDGKIILGGYSQIRYFALARFTTTGTLDTTFGQTGTARAGTAYVPFSIAGGGAIDIANSITVQSDGKIILGGYSNDGVNNRFAIARFTTQGTVDTTFGQVGTARAGTAYLPFFIAVGGTNDKANSITLQSDGKIVLGGFSSDGFNNRFAIARFTTQGTVDTTFGQTGTARAGTAYVPFSIAGGGTNDKANSITLQSDGKIVLGGYSNNGADAYYFALARFTASGTLDTTTFGRVGSSTAGTTYIPFSISGQTQYDQANTILLQPNGNIVLGGYTNNNNTQPSYFAIARIVSNQLDS